MMGTYATSGKPFLTNKATKWKPGALERFLQKSYLHGRPGNVDFKTYCEKKLNNDHPISTNFMAYLDTLSGDKKKAAKKPKSDEKNEKELSNILMHTYMKMHEKVTYHVTTLNNTIRDFSNEFKDESDLLDEGAWTKLSYFMTALNGSVTEGLAAIKSAGRIIQGEGLETNYPFLPGHAPPQTREEHQEVAAKLEDVGEDEAVLANLDDPTYAFYNHIQGDVDDGYV